MTKIQETGDKVLANVERVIVGKHHEVRLALVALLCRGHLLIEDVPGTGKTVLAKAIARSLGCTFRRIQFTPDLLPSDVTGLSIYNQKTQEFEFRPGPIMSQVVLADEINRATPKTQSALLECMEERQATIDGHDLPDARPVPRHRDPEPDRVRGHVRAARGPARPVHAPDPARLPAAARGDRDPRRAEADPPARGPRGRLLASRSCASCRRPSARSTSTRRSPTTSSASSARPGPSRRLPRRLAARLDRAVPRRPGARRAARPRLRHPRRHQGPRRAGARPPRDHQDELVDPRRPGRRRSSASCSRRPPIEASGRPACGGPREIRSTSGAGVGRRRRPAVAGARARSRPSMFRRLQLLVHRRRSSWSPRSRPACRSCSTSCTSAARRSAGRTS